MHRPRCLINRNMILGKLIYGPAELSCMRWSMAIYHFRMMFNLCSTRRSKPRMSDLPAILVFLVEIYWEVCSSKIRKKDGVQILLKCMSFCLLLWIRNCNMWKWRLKKSNYRSLVKYVSIWESLSKIKTDYSIISKRTSTITLPLFII